MGLEIGLHPNNWFVLVLYSNCTQSNSVSLHLRHFLCRTCGILYAGLAAFCMQGLRNLQYFICRACGICSMLYVGLAAFAAFCMQHFVCRTCYFQSCTVILSVVQTDTRHSFCISLNNFFHGSIGFVQLKSVINTLDKLM